MPALQPLVKQSSFKRDYTLCNMVSKQVTHLKSHHATVVILGGFISNGCQYWMVCVIQSLNSAQGNMFPEIYKIDQLPYVVETHTSLFAPLLLNWYNHNLLPLCLTPTD